MHLIQFLLVLGVVIAALLSTKSLPQDSSLAVKRIVMFLGVIAAILAIIFPNALTIVANAVGVGRGTDMLLYLFIIASLLYTASSERKRRRSEQRVTDLSRAVALLEARLTASSGESSPKK